MPLRACCGALVASVRLFDGSTVAVEIRNGVTVNVSSLLRPGADVQGRAIGATRLIIPDHQPFDVDSKAVHRAITAAKPKSRWLAVFVRRIWDSVKIH
jgi:hypothetical protein